jgi:DNA-binding protein H-NS
MVSIAAIVLPSQALETLEEHAMAKKTYAELVRQIEDLRAEAESVRREEVDGVIARIREAISAYELTPEDLFGGRTRTPRGRAKREKAPAAARRARRTGNAAPAAKYSDKEGNSWGGRGPRPKWLRDALANGATLEQFATKS